MKDFVISVIGWPNFLRRLQWPTIHDLLDLHAGQTVLDLGAGPMQYATWLARHDDAYIIAADLDFGMDRIGMARRNGVVPLLANGQALPLEDRSIDRILMSSLLHMVPEPSQLLRECLRVLKPGGCMVLSVPNHYLFIPVLLSSFLAPILRRLIGLPRSQGELVRHLNELFHVGGSQGYYSLDELTALLELSGFSVAKHEYAPGRLGSLLWELGVLGYFKFGNIAFHLLFLAFPLAKFADFLVKPTTGSEHIVKVLPNHDF